MIPKLGQIFYLKKDNYGQINKVGIHKYKTICIGKYVSVGQPGIYFIDEADIPTFDGASRSVLASKQNITDLKTPSSSYKCDVVPDIDKYVGKYYRFADDVDIEPYILADEPSPFVVSSAGATCTSCKQYSQYAVDDGKFMCWACKNGPFAGLIRA